MIFKNGMTAFDLQKSPKVKIEYIIDGVLPKGLTILAGPEKAGKSTLATQMALAIGAGNKFVGNFKTTQSEGIYLSLEEAGELTQDRIQASYKDDATKKIKYFFNIESIAEGGLDRLENYLEQCNDARVVIIDHLSNFTGVASKRNTEGENAKRFHDIAKRYGVAIVIIHHLVKKITGSIKDIRGSGEYTRTADNILMLTKDESSGIGKLRRVGRYGDADYALKYHKESLSWNYLGEFDVTVLTPERLDVLEVLFEQYGPVEVKEIRKEVRKTPSATSNLLKILLKQGFVRKPTFRTYEITEAGRNAVLSQ